jgi:hypothetical protein
MQVLYQISLPKHKVFLHGLYKFLIAFSGNANKGNVHNSFSSGGASLRTVVQRILTRLPLKRKNRQRGLMPDPDHKIITPNPNTSEINDASSQGVPRNAGGRGHLRQKQPCRALPGRNDGMDKFVLLIRYCILERGF